MLQPIDCHNGYTLVLVALGSNVNSVAGSPVQTVAKAASALAQAGLQQTRISRVFRTPAFPEGSGPDFANAAMALETRLSEAEVLKRLHGVEAQFSRERPARWAPRTLDLDLLAYGDKICPDVATFREWANLSPQLQQQKAPDQLILPHPRLHERAFVLLPLLDVAPDWVHPVFGQTVQQMSDALSHDLLAGIAPVENG